ncbi:S-adenosyl-L-methionine-dependent methyltransferase [Powellomyces hirtus]|nr:S-adenosyl-L-methionine-dependent methyltransferase [Powellomyces hirtus]
MTSTLIYDHLMANRRTALLMVAVKLNLFTHLARRVPPTIHASDVAATYDMTLRGADAMLVGLHSMGLLKRCAEQPASGPAPAEFSYKEPYALTAESERELVADSPHYLGHLINMDATGYLTPDNLLESMKRGKPQVHGNVDPWEKQEEDTELNTMFTLGMRSISIVPAVALRKQTKVFADRKVVLDVGAGPGVHLAEILKEWPRMNAVYFDLPKVCQINRPYLDQQGVADRIEMKSGSMFKDPFPTLHGPSGHAVDTVILSQILHDWPIDVGATLLGKAYDALAPGGIVVIHEKLLNDTRSGPISTAMVSVDMLLWTEGQQYTAKKLMNMLLAAGFTNPESINTVDYWSITLAVKPNGAPTGQR